MSEKHYMNFDMMVDLETVITTPRERFEAIKCLVSHIEEEGEIDEIRALVNSPEWDDQPPA